MREGPADAFDLLAGLLTHVRAIVGEGASYAMFHYGAVEEGKRIGATFSPDELARALDSVGALLGHETTLVEDAGDVVTLRVTRSRLLSSGEHASQGIVLGLLEGALSGCRKTSCKATIEEAGAAGHLIVLRGASA